MNRKRYLQTIAFWVLGTAMAFAQKEQVWIKQMTVADVRAFEHSINPAFDTVVQNVFLSKAYYPLMEQHPVALPLIVMREKVGYLPYHMEYFFSLPDSIVRFVSCDWEIGRFENFLSKPKIWKKESRKFDQYDQEYIRISNNLKTELGAPTTEDVKAKKTGSGSSSYLSRETNWENDAYFAQLSMIFSTTTYRIRLIYYWKD